MEDLACEVFADGLAAPEGPVCMGDGSVIVVEIAAGRVTRCWGDGRKETVATPGGGPNGAAVGADGALYVCNNGGIDHEKMCHASGVGHEGRIERIDLSSGRVERVYEHCDGEALSAPNDLVIDADGSIWFSDLGKFRERSHELGGIFHAQADGSAIRCLHRGVTGFNGVGLSPDGGTLYVAETFTGRLLGFDTRAGKAAGPWLVGRAPGLTGFDSLAVTEAGNICVACPSDAQIASFTPDGAVTIVPLPAEMTTNIAFGGTDSRTAFVTETHGGLLLRVRWTEPGLRLAFNA